MFCICVCLFHHSGMWSHKIEIYATNQSSNRVHVIEYHINPSLWARSGSDIGHIDVVVAHETGHFLGLPDLYDYGDGEGMLCNVFLFENSYHDAFFLAHLMSLILLQLSTSHVSHITSIVNLLSLSVVSL